MRSCICAFVHCFHSLCNSKYYKGPLSNSSIGLVLLALCVLNVKIIYNYIIYNINLLLHTCSTFVEPTDYKFHICTYLM